jgi:lipid-A-disaccharide synthase
MRPPVIMLVAAEASGDVLGADLIAALRDRLPGARFVGLGGPRMTAAGVVSPFDIAELSIFGVFEALAAYPKVVRRIGDLVALAERDRPDVAVLIDSWGFTSRLAKALRRRLPGVTLVKYVGPQVWASRPGRAKTLAGLFDHLLAILPFDAPFYEGLGVDVTFVGNPVMVREADDADAARFRRQIGADADDPILLVLPGSRPSEIERMMPPFEEAARLARAAHPDLHIVIPAAPTIAEAVKARVAAWPFRAHVVEGDGAKRDAMKAATVALACSGTVTTEVALAGCPFIVAYRMSAASHAVAKRLIRTRFITLLNIAANREVAPEFIQDAATGPALARAVIERLDDPALRAAQVAAQDEALKEMGRGGPDPSIKAADVIVGLVARRGA